MTFELAQQLFNIGLASCLHQLKTVQHLIFSYNSNSVEDFVAFKYNYSVTNAQVIMQYGFNYGTGQLIIDDDWNWVSKFCFYLPYTGVVLANTSAYRLIQMKMIEIGEKVSTVFKTMYLSLLYE